MQKKYLLIPVLILVGLGAYFYFFHWASPSGDTSDTTQAASETTDGFDTGSAATDTNNNGIAGDMSDADPQTPTLAISPQNSMNAQQTAQPPAMQIDKSKTYVATIQTSEGDIVVVLNAAQTPITVNNFVALAKKGFYNNTIFHRVIKGFMIQGGDPNGNGTGGPGYKFADEPFEGDYTAGTIAMANAGPNTNGSQFFIMHKDYALPKDYIIFGKVTSGMDVVDRIATAPTSAGASGEGSTPVTPVVVKSITIKEQ